ncbi:iron complex outermembrane recepter protein [Chitinophaga eiseniae]|uniref:Iron complex outermembrane recepter protein n=2 Tax=Chitinophaga eiseniae TaxID=634771 RepID=A0A1T4KAJ9_9BACT|nr:iron complex outermembrane recepter protein [Chitinophaga eiseniae]
MFNYTLHMKKSILCSLFLCLVVVQANAQQEQVKGATQDETGNFLPGVSIRAIHAGTNKSFATISSERGLFSFANLPEGGPYQFIFNYMGYQPDTLAGYTISNGKQLALSVKLRPVATALQEVVIGYSRISRKDVTSSITSIKAKDFNQGVFNSPAQILQGKVPGLVISASNDPNATPSVTLRGSSTLRSGEAMEPYYVIDGVPGASLALVAPDDIASIDILRDAAATAIYGSKAANGVIIVTTKKGKTNQSAITYNGYVSVDKVAKNLDMMDAAQYRSYVLDNGFSLDPYDDMGANTNWQKEVQRTGISDNHNVSIIGGNEKTQYNASINYFKNNGVIKGTDMNRLIGRAGVQTRALNNRMELAFNLTGSLTKQNDVPAQGQGLSVYDAMAYYLPISPVKNQDGSWFEYPQRSQYANPVSLVEENTMLRNTKLLQAHVKAGYEILSGLKYNLDLSLQNRQFNQSSYNSTKSMVAAGMNGRAIRTAVEDKRVVFETNFNYEKTFGRHKVGALVGYSWEENNNNDGFQLSSYNYYNDDLSYYNPGVANNIDITAMGDYNLSTLRMISVYSRVNYALDGKYLLQATVRRDGSSAFGINNRWGTFPSVSAAWRMSEESFIKSMDFFDDLKLRAGYGISGNSLGFDVFTATRLYGATGWFTNAAGQQMRALGAIRNDNPDLRWERTGMLNLGVDFAMFRNRLSGSVEFYDKKTKDLIYDYAVTIGPKYQFGILTTNVGQIDNKGFEVSLNGTPVQTQQFSWNTGIVFSHNKNKVVKISNEEFSVNYIDLADLDGAGQSNARQQRLIEGYPIGQFYTWEWAGYNDEGVSTFYVRNKDTGEKTGETTTTPMDKDRAATGSAQPKYTLGWNNNFSYKNLSLTMLFQGVFGNKIMNGTRARHSNVRGNAGNKNLLASVVETERVTDFNSHYLSDRYLENGDYLRLASLSLSYTFRKIGNGLKNVRVFATVNNAFVITKYKGLDPEVNLGGITPGIDNRQTYPKTRTFMFGVNFNL